MRKSGFRTVAVSLMVAGFIITSPTRPGAQNNDQKLPGQTQAAQLASYQTAMQLFQRGRQLQLANKEAEAEKVFASSLSKTEKLLLAEPTNSDYLALKAANLFRLKRYQDVVSLVQKNQDTRKDYRVIETLAESLYFLGQNEEALRTFSRYVELAPPNEERMSSAYYYIGECYIRLKKYEHADIAFTTATTMEKQMYYWWYRLGYVKEMLGRYMKAYEAYGACLKLNPGFTPARDGQARVKAKTGL